MTIAPRPPVAPPEVRTPAAVARIRWSISPEALNLTSGSASLVWTIDLDAEDPRAEATLETMHGLKPLREAAACIIRDAELTHVQAEGGLLSATFGADGQVLYARTSLLAELQVPGGRYEIS